MGSQPDWGWEAHRHAQTRLRAKASYGQRLAWLEDAIAFAHAAGALRPRRSGEEDGRRS